MATKTKDFFYLTAPTAPHLEIIPAFKRLSPSCQQIIHESLYSTAHASITIRSNLADPNLLPTITNHRCNNVILTPSGLYFDMALTVAKYIHSVIKATDELLPAFNVRDMEVHKPLLVKDIALVADAWIEMETVILSRDSENDDLKCNFHTITPSGVRLQTIGHCYVRYENTMDWLEEWSPQTGVILDRIDHLLTGADKETSDVVRLVQQKQAYKMFETFVQYSGKYQNMVECVFDSETLEATSLLSFHHLDLQARGFSGPYLWDGTCHVSGFVCNAVEKDKDKYAFISNGVESMRVYNTADIVGGGEVRNYVRMEVVPGGDKTLLQGNVFVLVGGEIIGVWQGVRFKRIPRRVLDILLPPGKKAL